MEENLSRNGHRQRMRNQYLLSGCDNMPDHNILELFLSVVIPRKDVKPIAYDLINSFGSLENVINADINDLMKVNGIGESTAIELKMVYEINKRIVANKNKGVKRLDSTSKAIEFCENILRYETVEKILMITLNSKCEVICHRLLASGSVNSAATSVRTLVEYAVRDNATCVIIAHNHPNGRAVASAQDIDTTIGLKSTFLKIGITLLDHIIVASDENLSMKDVPQFKKFFQ